MPDAEATLKRGLLNRLFGRPATRPPGWPDCWRYENGRIEIDLDRTPELDRPGTAVRLESGALPCRVLLVRCDDGTFRAFHNRCRHGGRRIDPVPGAGTVQCCSVNRSTYAYDGSLLRGPAKGALETYPVTVENRTLVIALQVS